MFLSLIICTKNRASQLKRCLKELAATSRPPCEMEVVIVDNGSTDTTPDVIKEFATAVPYKVTRVTCEKPGLGRARNFGLAEAKGEWLLFTDDDCYVEKDFFLNFVEFVKVSATSPQAKDIKFGGGPILPYDKQHDPRVATLYIDTIKLLPANTMLGAGVVQGANMFYHRAVFAGAGTFNDNMGAGTPFACEDSEMSARRCRSLKSSTIMAG